MNPLSGALLACFILVSGTQHVHSFLLPSTENAAFELIVRRDSTATSSPCTSVQLRPFGTYKGLSDLPGGIDVHNITTAREPPRVRAYAQDAHALWTEAQKLCGDASSWNFPVLVDDTHAHASAAYQDGKQAIISFPEPAASRYPPLEVHRLIESGPSANRVDLMFFSDGCRCPFDTHCRKISYETAQTLLLRNKSSSVMRCALRSTSPPNRHSIPYSLSSTSGRRFHLVMRYFIAYPLTGTGVNLQNITARHRILRQAQRVRGFTFGTHRSCVHAHI
jgi:hypothetical protein